MKRAATNLMCSEIKMAIEWKLLDNSQNVDKFL